MAGSLNKVMIIGNLGQDPEVRSFQSGGKVCNLRIATTESWKDQSGAKQERTEWHTVAIFGDGLVSIAERFLRKGSKVFVEGQLQTRKWQDQSGNDRYPTEIVIRGFGGGLTLLDGAQGSGGDRGQREQRGERRRGYDDRGSGQQQNTGGGSWGTPDDLDDDIPF